jgi:pimeloyl-ACP methyl ester carboxylesterase
MKDIKPSIVFCHGIWADGSCFSKVIPTLQAEGHQCIAAQYSLNTTADDVATVKRALGRVSSPAILVGHSYGGSVITGAGTDDRVAGLVYLAAFAPDADETSDTQPSKFPKTDVLSHVEVADGRIWLLQEGIESFAGDLSEQEKNSFGRPSACRLQTCSRRKREERRGSRSQAGTSSPRTTAPYSLSVSASSLSAWAPRRRKSRAATW